MVSSGFIWSLSSIRTEEFNEVKVLRSHKKLLIYIDFYKGHCKRLEITQHMYFINNLLNKNWFKVFRFLIHRFIQWFLHFLSKENVKLNEKNDNGKYNIFRYFYPSLSFWLVFTNIVDEDSRVLYCLFYKYSLLLFSFYYFLLFFRGYLGFETC